jgi:hypothetical protein
MGFANILIAVVIGVVVWRTSMWIIRLIGNPPPEVDPADVVEVDQDFRCSVCGAEVTMRAANQSELVPPKHCREEMTAVPRAAG